MGVYKRVLCPQCERYQEFRSDKDKPRKATCPKCAHEFNITDKNATYYIDYCRDGKRLREKIGPDKTLAEAALSKRQTQITENKFFDVRREATQKELGNRFVSH